MAKAACSCGNSFDAPPGDAICPACGSVIEVAAEKIRITCTCGAAMAAPARLAGKRVKCPKCAASILVPAPEPELDFAAGPEPVAAAPPPLPRRTSVTAKKAEKPPPPAPVEDGWRTYARWALVLALVPLILSVFTPDDKPLERLQHMLEKDPALQKSLDKLKEDDDLIAHLPDHRIEGALHSKDTWAHWIYALLSAAAFWGLILLLFPLGRSTSTQIWIAGVFVGTVGILLLLGLQYVAMWTQGTWIRGRGLIVIFFYIIKFIGFSYGAAMDPSNGFFLSMLGFTFGVGLCEELCKALPLLWHFKRTSTLDLRGAVAWGLAAGIGFGVSEGITYSSDYYNGVSTGGIYIVRFVSCVALHAIWSATNAIFLYKRQAELDAIGAWYEWFVPLFLTLGSSMVLHGLYDTLLKRDMEGFALLSAVVSFALFFWLYQKTVNDETASAPAAA